MSHYEERLQEDLDQVKEALAALAGDVKIALEQSVHALLARDRNLASRIILEDLAINRATRAVDKQCHAFVARHLPAAGILRYVSSVMRLTVALERIGDYAVTISREAVALQEDPPSAVTQNIELMADHARQTFAQAVEAFSSVNAELARGTMAMADQLSRSFDKFFSVLVKEGEANTRATSDLFALFVVLNRLERVSNQSKNICEETVFAVTGEQKAPKRYSIHFLDGSNDCWGLLAEAYCRKAFPESGKYSSSGWEPASAPRAGLAEFLAERGLDAHGLAPEQLTTVADDLSKHHIIVGLEPGTREHLEQVPFHTVLLEWDLGPQGQGGLDEGFKKIAHEVRELMELLHDGEAS